MARRMIGDRALVARADILDLEHVHDELGELEYPWADACGLVQQRGVTREQIAVENPDHAGARARRNHDRGARLDRIEKAARQVLCLLAKAFIEGGLPAAERAAHRADVKTEPFEHRDSG